MNSQKKPNNFLSNIKYTPKILTTAGFFILMGAVMILFQGRKSEFFRIDGILNMMPDFYLHISNFSISYLFYAGIGYFWLMMGIRFKYIMAFGISMLLANFIYELFIPILNTPDITDAYFGFWGTMLGFVFLSITKKYGLNVNEALEGKDS